MQRSFNTAGPNNPEFHYTLDPEPRLPELRALIDKRNYFVLHAPRQTGKTTLLDTMARKLTAEGNYTALLFSIEGSRPFSKDVSTAIANALDSLKVTANAFLPEPLRPPDELFQNIPEPSNGLLHVLSKWAQCSPRLLVIFIDEIDAVAEDALLSILHQLRNGYKMRPHDFPQSLALIGLRDVRGYKVRIRPERESLGTASPFNIKARSLTLENFTPEQVRALYHQHTEETGQVWTEEATTRAYELTKGQPWLVNSLAEQIVDYDVTDRSVAITRAHIDASKETLILRRDTHLDSLAERLREPRVRRVIEPILVGSDTGADVYDDDLLYVADLGLITRPPGKISIANPIYAEVIPRVLSFVIESFLAIEAPWFILPDGRLDMHKLFTEFQKFYRRNGEIWIERHDYKEAGPHLILYAWLQRIVNGGGHIDRESAIGGGRADILIEWPVTTDPKLRRWPIPNNVVVQREVIELKLYESSATETEGLEQLGRYLNRVGESSGHLLIFDRRANRNWDEKIYHKTDVPLPAPFDNLRAEVWGL